MNLSSSVLLKLCTALLYCSLHPLEYSSILWNQYTAADFFTSASFILDIPHLPHNYGPVMHKLSLTSLADRRVEANLVLLRKLIDGCLDAPSLLYGKNNPIHHMCLANEHLSFS